MTDFEKGQKAIKNILKYGDLYDVIAKSENAKETSNPMFRAHLFLFSRILYGVLLTAEKIGSYFSPVEKIKEAQEDIRSLLNVNIDVIREKGNNDMLNGIIFPQNNKVSLLYADDHAFMDEYIANLQKILSFCIIHKLAYVYLDLEDLDRLFDDLNLDAYVFISLTYILNKAGLSYRDDGKEYLILKQDELQRLISQLMEYKIDKELVMQLGKQIDDPALEMALNQFEQSGNLEDFKNVLVSRLGLNINSDSGYKNRNGEKVADTVSISGEYIKVISTIEGSKETPKTTIMLLCEYLGYSNYEALLNSLKHLGDDKDRLLMATIHLYINSREKIGINSSCDNVSLYDKLYENYLKRKNNRKMPKGYRYPLKITRILTNVTAMFLALCVSAVPFAASLVGLYGIDFLKNNFFKKEGEESDITNAFIEGIIKPYTYSWRIEKSLIEEVAFELANIKPEFSDGITNTIGEGLFGLGLGSSDEKVVGRVYALDEDYGELPKYYAAEYGASSKYHKGDITYDLKEQVVDYAKMQPLNSVLKVEAYFSKKELRQMIKDNTITIPMALYPLDKNYVLTRIIIYDRGNSNVMVKLSAIRANICNGNLTDNEVDILKSMKYPTIEFYYGINELYYNSFVRNIVKNGPYLETSEDKMHDVITGALGLPPYASYEEIYAAIKSKKYSLNPFGDSKVKVNTKKMDEKEFIGTVASMDYLICNLAATLAVEANQDLTYVVGFMSGDDTITYGEAHAWAVSPSGEIVEVTPSDIDEEDEKYTTIKNVLDWANQNKIPFIITLGLISSIIYNLFGKRIIFNIKVRSLNHLLNSDQMPEAYSYLNETRFGGINLPKDHTSLDYLSMLDKDFEGYTKDELQELLKRLKEGQNPSKPLAIKVVKRVPFIKQNEKQITRKLTKNI